ncbi:hypothetical protein [Glutamicibacter sp. NPDC087673]|uniref:hypothetical protein n=1 Tax=Glutamicibacter sp. NPDC087673 TaxID=3363997 RepID=UPI0038144F20
MESTQPEEERHPGITPTPDEPAEEKQNSIGDHEDAFEQPAEEQDPDQVDTDQFNTD